ncbi:MAG: hypothetical protein LC749_02565 [Actinobacteria bacterium]|nr:hypothetical protein [Actinomycetota bacterium]
MTVLAAAVFLLIKIGFALSVTTDVDRIVRSLRPSVEDVGRASLAVILGFAVGAQWGRRRHQAFLFGHLMMAAPHEDRGRAAPAVRSLGAVRACDGWAIPGRHLTPSRARRLPPPHMSLMGVEELDG